MSFQKPTPKKCEPVQMAVVGTRHEDPTLITVNCGWQHHHPRKKVREDAAERHLAKRHNGQGVWM